MTNQKTQNVRELILESFYFSISAHNVQPFRVKFNGQNQIELWAERERFLPAADPKNKDLVKSSTLR